MPKVNMYRIDRYTTSGWQPDEVTVIESRWGKPEDLAREILDLTVQRALHSGQPVEEYDGVIRILFWAREEDVYEKDELPTRYPDAMVTWYKPDTSILEAAIQKAAQHYRTREDMPDNMFAKGQYAGAVDVAQRVHDAHRTLHNSWKQEPSTVAMIETAAALLPDHRN